jgi:hypothetical protein
MRSLSFLWCVALLMGPAVFAQTRHVTLCLVQVARNDHDMVQDSGMDAKNLAVYLSDRTLSNGTPVLPVVVIQLRPDAVDLITEERGCQYIAEFVRHESVDTQRMGSPASEPGTTVPGSSPVGLDPVEAPPIGDRDTILFTLRKAGSRKVLGHLAAPPLTRRGKTAAVLFDPYPLFVKEIMKKIPATETGIISEPANPDSEAMPNSPAESLPSTITAPDGYSSFDGTWIASRNGKFDGRFHLRLEKGSKVTAAKLLETGLDEPLLLHGRIDPKGAIEMRDYPGCPSPCMGSLSADGHQIRWRGNLLWDR